MGDLNNKLLKTFEVSESEKNSLAILNETLSKKDLNDPTPFLKTANRLACILFPNLHAELTAVRNRFVDAIFLKNLPFYSEEHKVRSLSLLLSCIVGNPFQFKQQNHGEIVAKVTPEAGFENTHSSSGRMKFGWHTDDAFLNECFRTDYILLSGCENPDSVETYLGPIDDIVRSLPQEILLELMKPVYSLKIPASFRTHGDSQVSNVPLVWCNGSRKWNAAFSEYNVLCKSEASALAFEALASEISSHSHSFNLQPATALLFNNSRVLHGRGEIKGHRTIFRVYIKDSLGVLNQMFDDYSYVFDLSRIILSNCASL